MLLDKYGHLKLADFGTCMRMGPVINIVFIMKNLILCFKICIHFVLLFIVCVNILY